MLTSAANQTYQSHDFKRRYERKPYGADIIFAINHRVYQGNLKDISVGGAFIHSRHTKYLSKGDLVTISVPFTDGSKHIKRSGRVLWKSSTGFAITFDQ